MVIVVFQDGRDWTVPNWVFRQVARDIDSLWGSELGVSDALQKARATGHLPLDRLEASLACRLTVHLGEIAKRTLNGELGGWKAANPDDAEGHAMYDRCLDALSALLAQGRGRPTSQSARC